MPKDKKKSKKKDKAKMSNDKKSKDKKKKAKKPEPTVAELTERGKSEWIDVRQSEIHATGVFAAKDIPEGTKIVEYVGPKYKNAEADRRNIEFCEKVEGTGEGSIYMFIVDKKHQIDGFQTYNNAKYLNHSCSPNSHTDVIKKRVWIIADRDIQKGEELVYDYGFDLEFWEDHPCLCGKDNCVGYIVSQDLWPKLKKAIAKKEKKEREKAAKRKKKAESSKKKQSGKKGRVKVS